MKVSVMLSADLEMAGLISDEVLHTFVVVSESPSELAAAINARWTGLGW